MGKQQRNRVLAREGKVDRRRRDLGHVLGMLEPVGVHVGEPERRLDVDWASRIRAFTGSDCQIKPPTRSRPEPTSHARWTKDISIF